MIQRQVSFRQTLSEDQVRENWCSLLGISPSDQIGKETVIRESPRECDTPGIRDSVKLQRSRRSSSFSNIQRPGSPVIKKPPPVETSPPIPRLKRSTTFNDTNNSVSQDSSMTESTSSLSSLGSDESSDSPRFPKERANSFSVLNRTCSPNLSPNRRSPGTHSPDSIHSSEHSPCTSPRARFSPKSLMRMATLERSASENSNLNKSPTKKPFKTFFEKVQRPRTGSTGSVIQLKKSSSIDKKPPPPVQPTNSFRQHRRSISASSLTDLALGSPKEKRLENGLLFEGNELIGGTIDGFLEKCLESSAEGQQFREMVLLCYRSVYTSNVLFNWVQLQFHRAQKYPRAKQSLVWLSLMQFLTIWITKYYYADFGSTPQLCFYLKNFIDGEISTFIPSYGNSLRVLLSAQQSSFPIPRTAAPSFVTSVASARDRRLLLNTHPAELARQFTLYEQRLISQIPLFEFIDKNWTREKISTPFISRAISRFNETVLWFQTQILTCRDFERATIIERIIDCAMECYTMGNFSTTMQIVACLGKHYISQLKDAWSYVSKRKLTRLQTLEEICSPLQNFKSLRMTIRKRIALEKPCIPYLGVYLTDLIFIEEGNPTFLDRVFVNYHKWELIFRTIQEIEYISKSKFSFLPNEELQSMIQKLESSIKNENTLMDLSKSISKSSIIAE